MKFEPMRAVPMHMMSQLIEFPYLVRPMLPGVRCYVKDGKALIRDGERIRNQFISTSLSSAALDGLDGMLVVGPPTAPDAQEQSAKWVVRPGGVPKFKFYVCDDFSVHGHQFQYRVGHAEDRVSDIHDSRLAFVEHDMINSFAGLAKYECAQVKKGYPGIVLMSRVARYKFGQVTEEEDVFWEVTREVSERIPDTALERLRAWATV